MGYKISDLGLVSRGDFRYLLQQPISEYQWPVGISFLLYPFCYRQWAILFVMGRSNFSKQGKGIVMRLLQKLRQMPGAAKVFLKSLGFGGQQIVIGCI